MRSGFHSERSKKGFMRLTLCVDAIEPQLGGIGRYTWELCQGLAVCERISQLRYYARDHFIHDPGSLRSADRQRRNRLVRAFYRWQSARALACGLVHGPNYFLPARAETGVITVHDLSVFRYPEMHPPERVRAFERLFGSSLARVAHVITDSQTVREELIESFSVSPESVTAVPLGVDAKF